MLRIVLGTGVLAGAAVWVVLTAGLGAIATDLGPWYRGLRKPSWQPPDWLFGPVWTVIFLLAALAAVIAWGHEAATAEDRTRIAAAWIVNGLLNIGWNLLFFTRKRPDWALAETVALWLSIVWMTLAVWPLEPLAALLLVPYLAWVAFAAVLNRAIVRLNGPFGGR